MLQVAQQNMRSSELLLRNIWRTPAFSNGQPILLHCRGLHHISPFTSIKPNKLVWPSHSKALSPFRHSPWGSKILRQVPVDLQHPALSFKQSLSGTSQPNQQEVTTSATKQDQQPKRQDEDEELDHEDEERGFVRSAKATQAAQVNLSARLAKDGHSQGQFAGIGEIWRLIKIARPEAGVLGFAFIFLLISSAISMSIPFSIGKILDIATNATSGDAIFGIELSTFYLALGGVLAFGAAANYGRIIILRIVGERIVARLRSQLFRRTFIQNAEFFDANRVGDLISRLSSDTIIVGKSITQNLSDGLRSLVSGGAGFGLMAYVSLKLTGILTLMFPPVAIGAFFYGKAIRNLSRKIQRNLGTLTKIAEERLGNVRTSQSFAGEILEVSRYNRQVKKIFNLGKREALISATFFSTVGFFQFSLDGSPLISGRLA